MGPTGMGLPIGFDICFHYRYPGRLAYTDHLAKNKY